MDSDFARKNDEVLWCGEEPSSEQIGGSRVLVHTLLDLDLQLEIGRATHSKAIRFVALAFIVVIIGYNIANLLIMKDNALLLLALSLGPCVLLFLFAFWIHNPLTMIKGTRQFKKQGRWPEYLVCFSDEGFTTASALSRKTYQHEYSEIAKVKETQSLILLICQSTVVALAKNRFLKGTHAELNELIQQQNKS